MTVGLSTTAIFCVFAGYFFGIFRGDASIIMASLATQSAVGFSVIPKCITYYFTLTFVFASVRTVWLPTARQALCSFWQCEVYAD